MSLISSKKVETNRVELTVEVKGELFTNAVEDAFRKNMKKITVPGFRKGKAPRAMVEKLYGKGVFLEDAVNEVYPKAYTEAVDELKIIPVDAADVEILNVDENGFTFKATVTTKPEVKLGEYKGLSAPKTVSEVTEDQISAQIEQLREKYARVITVEDRAAKLGDIAEINFEGFVDDVAFEGGKGENHPLTLGSGSFIPGFEEQVVGHNVGEEFDVNVTFPEEYGEKSLAGKAATFKVNINAIKERQLPDVDDEFAKDISEFDTIDAYKNDLKDKMQKSAEAQADSEFENKLLAQVVEGMTVEVPDCMIESRIDEQLQEFEYRLSQQGLNIKDFMRYTGDTEEKFRENFRAQAEGQVKTRLAMEAVAAAEGIVATEADIDAEYKKLAEQYHTEAEKLRGIINEKELREDFACRKALEVITSSATVAAEEKAPKEKKATKTAKAADAEAAPKKKAPAKKTTKKATEGEAAEAEAKPKRTRKPKADAE